MLSIGLDWVGMLSSAVWATVWSWGTSVMMAVCLLYEGLCYVRYPYVSSRGKMLVDESVYEPFSHGNFGSFL